MVVYNHPALCHLAQRSTPTWKERDQGIKSGNDRGNLGLVKTDLVTKRGTHEQWLGVELTPNSEVTKAVSVDL